MGRGWRMEMDELDRLLGRLRSTSAEAELDGLEAGVWARLARAQTAGQASASPRSLALIASFAIGMGVLSAGVPIGDANPQAALAPFGPSPALVPSTLLAEHD